MKNTIKIGPIQKSQEETVTSKIRSQINKMKLGEFFNVYGVDRSTVNSLRASISYYSKKDKVAVATSHKGDVLTVEKRRFN